MDILRGWLHPVPNQHAKAGNSVGQKGELEDRANDAVGTRHKSTSASKFHFGHVLGLQFTDFEQSTFLMRSGLGNRNLDLNQLVKIKARKLAALCGKLYGR